MKSDNDKTLYLKLILGSIGIILIALGLFEFASVASIADSRGYLLSVSGLAGFILTVQYIYFLEEKAGINKKQIWVRAGLIILILSIYLFFSVF